MQYQGHMIPHPEVKVVVTTFDLEAIARALVIARDRDPRDDDKATWKRIHEETMTVLGRVKGEG